MIRILKFLITGDWHLHKWVPVGEADYRGSRGSTGSVVYTVCQHCGERRMFMDSEMADWERPIGKEGR